MRVIRIGVRHYVRVIKIPHVKFIRNVRLGGGLCHLVFSRVQRPSAVLATGMIVEGMDRARICVRWFIVSLGPFCYMAQFLLVGHSGDSLFEGRFDFAYRRGRSNEPETGWTFRSANNRARISSTCFSRSTIWSECRLRTPSNAAC